MNVLKKIFKFCSNVKLAIIIILSWATILTVATIIESKLDAQAARYYIYQTWWFYFLLFMLGVNVTCAAFSRWPWRKHHIGFLVTHLGIVTLLVGSAINLFGGFEGSLALEEGESNDRILLDEPHLYLFNHGAGEMYAFPTNFRFDTVSPQDPFKQKTKSGLEVEIDNYYHHAQKLSQVTNDNVYESESPAVELAIKGSRASIKQWLFARDMFADLGPAQVAYFIIKSADEMPGIKSKHDQIQKSNMLFLYQLNNQFYAQLKNRGIWQEVHPIKLGDSLATGWMDFSFSLVQYYPKAREQVTYRKFISAKEPNGPPPAIHFKISGEGGQVYDRWMQLGDLDSFVISNENYSVFYRYKSLPLGFYLALNKFEIGKQEGNDAPASFESYVTVKAKEGQFDSKIFMNNPLVMGRFKIFQASFQDNPGGNKVSVFQIAYDPGIWVKYIGSALIVSGIILMFYFKPLFVSRWTIRGKDGIE